MDESRKKEHSYGMLSEGQQISWIARCKRECFLQMSISISVQVLTLYWHKLSKRTWESVQSPLDIYQIDVVFRNNNILRNVNVILKLSVGLLWILYTVLSFYRLITIHFHSKVEFLSVVVVGPTVYLYPVHFLLFFGQ